MKKIKKILIKNFRGVNGEQIFDFSDKLTVLDGENGFGKTTLFDAIEFCFTGKISKFTKNSGEATNKPDKIIRNNEAGLEEVVVEVFFDDKLKIKRVIDEKERNESKNYLDDTSEKNKLDLGINIDNYKNYFYLPQLDSIDLIRESTTETKGFIERVIGTEKEADLLNKITNRSKRDYWFKKIDDKSKFYNRNKEIIVKQLGDNTDNKTGLYKEISDLEKEIKKIEDEEKKFISDKDASFKKLSLVNEYKWNSFINNVDNTKLYYKDLLNDWKNVKDISDNKNSLQLYRELNFLKGAKDVIVENYLYYDDFKINENYFKSYIDSISLLKTYIDNVKKLEKDIDYKKIDNLFINIDVFKEESFYNELKRKNEEYIKLKEKINKLNNNERKNKELYGKLIDFWDINSEKFNEDKKCPLCKSEETFEQIPGIIKEYKKNSGYIDLKDDVNDIGKTSFSLLYDVKLLNVLEKFLEKLTVVSNILNNIDKLKGFSKFLDLKYNENILGLKIGDNLSIDKKIYIEKIIDDFINSIDKNIKSTDLNHDDFIKINSNLKEYFNGNYNNEKNNLDLDIINGNIKFIEYKMLILEGNNKVKILKDLEVKNKTIEDFEKKLNVLNNRINFIESFQNQVLKRYSTILSAKINDYKRDIINSISLPFYIFCSRIIKNYNGTGVYLTSDSIKTIYDNSNPGYTFSSGQLEGVILAVLLSTNMNQNMSDLDTIFIDDPIQSLDDLNILSFINLLRYQFKDKQIIISTHDADFSNLIRYKYMNLGLEQKNINMKERYLEK